MGDLLLEALPELIATLVGVAVGGAGALFADRRAERKRKRRRRSIVLRNLIQELLDAYSAMKVALPVFEARGSVHFYISTIAWETAVASGDLPETIGIELADTVENQYAMYFQLKFYLDTLAGISHSGAEPNERLQMLSESYRATIVKGMHAAIQKHPGVIAALEAQSNS